MRPTSLADAVAEASAGGAPLAPLPAILVIALLLYAGPPAAAAARVLGRLRSLIPLPGLFATYLIPAPRELRPRPRGRGGGGRVQRGGVPRAGGRPPGAGRGGAVRGLRPHTRTQDAQRIPAPGGPEVTYLDTGTWTGLYIEERPDLQGRAFRPFLRFSPGGGRDEYAHEHRRWNDDPGAPGPTEILGPVRRTGWGGEEPVQPSEPRPAEVGDAQPAVGP